MIFEGARYTVSDFGVGRKAARLAAISCAQGFAQAAMATIVAKNQYVCPAGEIDMNCPNLKGPVLLNVKTQVLSLVPIDPGAGLYLCVCTLTFEIRFICQ